MPPKTPPPKAAKASAGKAAAKPAAKAAKPGAKVGPPGGKAGAARKSEPAAAAAPPPMPELTAELPRAECEVAAHHIAGDLAAGEADPPPAVKQTLSNACTFCLGEADGWEEARTQLAAAAAAAPGALPAKLAAVDAAALDPAAVSRLAKYCQKNVPDKVLAEKAGVAAAVLCRWLHALKRAADAAKEAADAAAQEAYAAEQQQARREKAEREGEDPDAAESAAAREPTPAEVELATANGCDGAVSLPAVQAKVRDVLAAGKVPLLVDREQLASRMMAHKMGTVRIDAQQIVADRSLKKPPRPDAEIQAELRATLAATLKHGGRKVLVDLGRTGCKLHELHADGLFPTCFWDPAAMGERAVWEPLLRGHIAAERKLSDGKELDKAVKAWAKEAGDGGLQEQRLTQWKEEVGTEKGEKYSYGVIVATGYKLEDYRSFLKEILPWDRVSAWHVVSGPPPAAAAAPPGGGAGNAADMVQYTAEQAGDWADK